MSDGDTEPAVPDTRPRTEIELPEPHPLRGYYGIGISHAKAEENIGTLLRSAASRRIALGGCSGCATGRRSWWYTTHRTPSALTHAEESSAPLNEWSSDTSPRPRLTTRRPTVRVHHREGTLEQQLWAVLCRATRPLYLLGCRVRVQPFPRAGVVRSAEACE